jgi:uncharacterized membrane protein (UPF0127 family)
MLKKILILFILAISVLIMGGCSPFGSDNLNQPGVILNTSKGKFTVGVEIADTFETRKRGLMFRPSMEDNHGMFFVFDKVQPLVFWMKNTLIPLDMVFIDANYRVISVAKNVQPCKVKDCGSFASEGDGLYVLEIKGGAADRYGLKKGDKVDWVKN